MGTGVKTLAGGRPRILIVEDHADTLTLMKRVLGRQGYDVATADGCQRARELIDAGHYDVVITDIELGDGSGWELCHQIKARTNRPVGLIAVSGHGMPKHVQESIEAGFCLHLTKPIDIADLLAAIEQCSPAEFQAR